MNSKQNKVSFDFSQWLVCRWLIIIGLLFNVSTAIADDLAINNLEFSSLAGNQVQIQIEMSGPVIEPKAFQTDNPSRIALDFAGVQNNLAKKSFPINQGPAGTVYVMEASGRTRVVINLQEKVPYETHSEGNKFYVLLKSPGALQAATTMSDPVSSASQKAAKSAVISRFLPAQSIKTIDFRRGPNGEGRLLLGLSTPNTVVDAKQTGGKISLNFLNTTLPESLIKSFDVADFATPVQKFEVSPKGDGVNIVVTPNNPNYEYSSYQADNLLTVEFRPLTPEEKEARLKAKAPYIGSKLSMNFQDIEVRSVLMILADHVKTQEGRELNIVTTDSVAGSMALHVNDVPWDQVLDVVLKLKKLTKRENGNVILVGPTEEIIDIEKKEREAKQTHELLEPLITENIQINYARAVDVCNVLMGQGNFNSNSIGNKRVSSSDSSDDIKDSNVVSQGAGNAQAAGCGVGGPSNRSSTSLGSGVSSLSGDSQDNVGNSGVISRRGSVIVDGRTNILIVKDTPSQLEEVREMISKLDVPVRQVSIEARIVIASTEFARDLGVKFGVAKMGSAGGDKNFAVGGAGTRSNSNAQPDADGNIGQVNDTLVDLGMKASRAYPPAALGMTLMRMADYVLNLELTALQNDNAGEILANPRLVTSDRVQARIKQGLEIPYVTVSQNGTQTQFKDAVLELNVTPQITPDGSIIMDLIVKKDNISDVTNAAMSGIEQRRIQTLARVNDGETIVLGGVYESEMGNDTYKVPFFADIPGLGWLFSNKVQSEQKRELLIFVTPKVIKDSANVNRAN